MTTVPSSSSDDDFKSLLATQTADEFFNVIPSTQKDIFSADGVKLTNNWRTKIKDGYNYEYPAIYLEFPDSTVSDGNSISYRKTLRIPWTKAAETDKLKTAGGFYTGCISWEDLSDWTDKYLEHGTKLNVGSSHGSKALLAKQAAILKHAAEQRRLPVDPNWWYARHLEGLNGDAGN